MKLNKKWCIALAIMFVMITSVPVFAESEGFIQKMLGGSSKVLLYSLIGGVVGVIFSLLKGKNRKR